MSISNAAIPSTFLKKLFDASSPTANLVSSILRAANHLLVCALAGNTSAILSNTLPTSTDAALPAPRQSNSASKYNRQSLIRNIKPVVNN
ncbi:hypothetical protein ARMGADRAFT_1082282 [Armillaria gallica]|uniref:Uncharacterized protein n=1 Tax=Armillaria gallica TaxID=47427 RepID=A0A2H3DB82_ARMGA|nr:hypothetical protein ARMGADRAFT_1082282 [Armillaria gallica]